LFAQSISGRQRIPEPVRRSPTGREAQVADELDAETVSPLLKLKCSHVTTDAFAEPGQSDPVPAKYSSGFSGI
jgi:hypothetical protein